MELISNLSFIEAAAKELIGPKPCPYSNLDLWKQVSTYGCLKCEAIEVKCEQFSNPFEAFYINHKQRPIQPCIIYLHGLSSYSLEGQYLLQYIQDKFSLCIYDLRGHGKNKTPQVTYGINQATDLYYLIKRLKQKGVEDIYLWGRSMGASTILNFINIYGGDMFIKETVKFVVLDSAFNSFQQIAKQTVAKNLGLPTFVCSPLVNVTLNKIIEKDKIDLKVLNFSNLEKVKYPAVFIYSERDAIVDFYHSRQIIQGYGGINHVIVGNFEHNDPRPFDVVKKAMSFFGVIRYQSIKNLYSPKSVTPKKGLSISLISSKHINSPSYKQLNITKQKQNSNPLSPKLHVRNVSPFSPTSPLTVYKEQGIEFTIKRDLVRQDRTKVKTSQQVIEERSKSKPKSKHSIPTLTNRRYI